jgi:hypothetical protein
MELSEVISQSLTCVGRKLDGAKAREPNSLVEFRFIDFT